MGKCKIKAIQTDLGTFRHNQAYPGIIQNIFKTLCNRGIFRAVLYPVPWHNIQKQKHIQNPGIFKPLVYSEPQYIQNPRHISSINDEEICENS